jgi:hypothetical protein
MLGRLFFLEGKNVLIGYFCGAWEKWFNRGIYSVEHGEKCRHETIEQEID